MKKFVENIKIIIRHNVFLATAAAVVICLSVWLIGCESTTTSPFNPTQKITRDQLAIQVDSYNKQVELAVQDLDQQDVFKQYLIDSALVVAQGGTLNPMGIALGALGILGLGATADNVRKNTVIKTLQNGQTKTV